MPKSEDDSAVDDGQSEAQGLAVTRSRRSQSRSKGQRQAALEKLKAAKAKEWKYTVEEEMVDNVYELVDEKKYAEKVRERLEDDFIIDDDGEYADDGREIFDDDEESSSKFFGPKKKAKEKEKEKLKKRSNIKNIFLNMNKTKKDANSKGEESLKDDALLESLLGEIKSSSKVPKNDAWKKHGSQVPVKRQARGTDIGQSAKACNPFLKPKTSEIKRTRKQPTYVPEIVEDQDQKESFLDSLEANEDSMEVDCPSQTVEEFDEAEISNIMDEDFIDEDSSQVDVKKEEPEPTENRGFLEPKIDPKKSDTGLGEWSHEMDAAFDNIKKADDDVKADINVDKENLPLTIDEGGEKVLRMYWLDAYEDPYKHSGTVWLFGKVYLEQAKAFVSCCVTVKNINRRVFLLKRENRFDNKIKKEVEGQEVKMADVYREFKDKVSEKFKITEFRSKTTEKLYAFEFQDVPKQAEYLEVQYSPKYPALPSDLYGETFSRVFGANRSSLEHFLISRKIKGPSWLDIKQASISNPPTSWCKVEAICTDPNNILITRDPATPPPLTILTLNIKTTINPKTMLNEISIINCLCNNEFYLDRAPPKEKPFNQYFSVMTKPHDEVWPFDLQKVMGSMKGGPKIHKMESERALLAFFLARVGKFDPDIVIGHDVTGFDIDVLVHRLVTNKIPHWSKLGRLKRSAPPHFRGKVPEKESMTGRLICDLKVSAKELIRCKSYDLGALIEKILGKSIENRIEVGCEEMRKAYENSKSLLHAVNLSIDDAVDTLQCIYELNALPLALQITQIAGNVMSRTLLGGRAERNEFLLLHAFEERNYICPDKQYGKKKVEKDLMDVDHEEGVKGKPGRKKPTYAGGLVLEPKKGFYDKFILLMDFNSLYPSIIQEYNICFTTVSRKSASSGDDEHDSIPDLPSPDCESGVLPTEIKKLVESRKVVKKLLKDPNISSDQRVQYDIRQKALKLTANSMYGCLGFSHSRFFAKPIAALITSRGREILLSTKNLVEKMNLEVIYGDTDSIMINTNSEDFNEVFKLGGNIKNEVNKLYKLLELDIDGVYRYMLLLKKKKYAAMAMEMKNGAPVMTPELKGLDIVRRDWSGLAASAGKTILNKILSNCTADNRIAFIHEHLEQLATDLKSGKVPLADLAITKQLTKNPSDYADKKALPHVQVAIRLNSKGGKKLKNGDTVQYVICDDGSSLPATQRAYHFDEVKDRNDLKIDINYYLSQQLHPVVSRLCEPLEGTDSARIAQCLGLDPEQFRKAMSSKDGLSAEEEATMREEDKFRECERLKIKCECGEEIVLDSVVTGTKDDCHLTLTRCPNIKNCSKKPIERLGYLKRVLSLSVRRHISQFYLGYLVCEDPACNGRTRQLPLDFKGAFPVCNTCQKAIMTKEFSDKDLYNQLLFYQTLFDVSKANSRYGRNFNIDLATIKDGLANYMALKQHVDRLMDLNKYSVIDMTKLFSGFSTVSAARFRKTKHI